MNKIVREANGYFCALSEEYSNSVARAKQKSDAILELNTLAVAIKRFLNECVHVDGNCEVKPQLPSCAVSRLVTGGESFILSLKMSGAGCLMNLLVMTFSKNGSYPCTLRTGQDVFSCKNISELRSCLKKMCHMICFFIVERAKNTETRIEPVGLNFTETAGSLGVNPAARNE